MAARLLRIGTRASLLARTQTQWVADQLSGRGVDVEIELVETSGDQRRPEESGGDQRRPEATGGY